MRLGRRLAVLQNTRFVLAARGTDTEPVAAGAHPRVLSCMTVVQMFRSCRRITVQLSVSSCGQCPGICRARVVRRGVLKLSGVSHQHMASRSHRIVADPRRRLHVVHESAWRRDVPPLCDAGQGSSASPESSFVDCLGFTASNGLRVTGVLVIFKVFPEYKVLKTKQRSITTFCHALLVATGIVRAGRTRLAKATHRRQQDRAMACDARQRCEW